MHAYIHICTHTHTHTHRDFRTRLHTHTHTHTHTNRYFRTSLDKYACAFGMLCGLNREKLAEVLIGGPSPNSTISHNTTQHHRLRLPLIGLSIAYLLWWCCAHAQEGKVGHTTKKRKRFTVMCVS